ncbi:MAG: hypothetical protein M1401_03425 [Chloroflexi bacterium]|nr:hypothetical protein [Chloroflexota bacterium]
MSRSSSKRQPASGNLRTMDEEVAPILEMASPFAFWREPRVRAKRVFFQRCQVCGKGKVEMVGRLTNLDGAVTQAEARVCSDCGTTMRDRGQLVDPRWLGASPPTTRGVNR